MRPEGVELVVTRSPSPEAMRRQLTAWEFDICEMAFGAYLIARGQGADVTAIPVFPRRAFFHTNFACHADSSVDGPRDLAHKRIGVAEYVQSATLWARGVLEHDFGLDPRKAQWYVERSGSGSTGEVLGFKPPRDISVQQTPGGKSLIAMLAAEAGHGPRWAETPRRKPARPCVPSLLMPSPKASAFTTRTAIFLRTTSTWLEAVSPASTRRSSRIFIGRSTNRKPSLNSRCLVKDRELSCSETNSLPGRANRSLAILFLGAARIEHAETVSSCLGQGLVRDSHVEATFRTRDLIDVKVPAID